MCEESVCVCVRLCVLPAVLCERSPADALWKAEEMNGFHASLLVLTLKTTHDLTLHKHTRTHQYTRCDIRVCVCVCSDLWKLICDVRLITVSISPLLQTDHQQILKEEPSHVCPVPS